MVYEYMSYDDRDLCYENCEKKCAALLFFYDNPLVYDKCYTECMEKCDQVNSHGC